MEVAGSLTRDSWSPGGRTVSTDEGGKTTIAVVRREPGPIELNSFASDPNDPPELTILQVVAPDNRLRPDVSAYSMELAR